MYKNLKELFKAICDAIREKEGSTEEIAHVDIPQRIANISTHPSCEFSIYNAPNTSSANNFKCIDGHIFTNFKSTTAGIFTPCHIDPTKPWEIGVMWKYTATNSNSQVIFGSWYDWADAPSLEIMPGAKDLWCGYSTSGSGWEHSLQAGATFDFNTWYFTKMGWDTEKLYLEWTSDFENYSRKTLAVTTQHYVNGYYSDIVFGGLDQTYAKCLINGSIDLDNTYIKSDGNIIWGTERYSKNK